MNRLDTTVSSTSSSPVEVLGRARQPRLRGKKRDRPVAGDNPEVSDVQREHSAAVSLGTGDYRGIGESEGKVAKTVGPGLP